MNAKMNTSKTDALPDFLLSFENLTEHFTAHFDALDSNARGDRFLDLAQKIVPFTDAGAAFPPPEASPKKSHDKGVDLLTVKRADDGKLCVQSKFKLPSKDDFDTIVSKFKDYESGVCQSTPLFPENDGTPNKPIYMIVTSSKLGGIVAAYEKSELASKQFYQTLVTENRVHIDRPATSEPRLA